MLIIVEKVDLLNTQSTPNHESANPALHDSPTVINNIFLYSRNHEDPIYLIFASSNNIMS